MKKILVLISVFMVVKAVANPLGKQQLADSFYKYKMKVAWLEIERDSLLLSTQYAMDKLTIEKKRREIALNIGNVFARVGDQKIRIDELERENKRLNYLYGIIFFCIVVFVLTRQVVKQVRKNKRLSEEKQKHVRTIELQNTVLGEITQVQAHEVRGPIATALGLLLLIRDNGPADPENEQLIEEVYNVTQRLDHIVCDLIYKGNYVTDAAVAGGIKKQADARYS